MKTALVLSAGGMFGAYQAGAWKALAGSVRLDLVVGASAGAINGWAIASGVTPEELIAKWLDPATASLMHVRRPWRPWRAMFDPAPLRQRAREMTETLHPRIPFAGTVVEVPALRLRLIPADQITWRHLVAMCAVPFGYPPVRLDGRLSVDGGLLSVLPVWAAAELGAQRVIAVNCLPLMPSRVVRSAAALVRRLAPATPAPAGLEIVEISPPSPLGTLRDAFTWNESRIRSWIERGEKDARLVLEGWAVSRNFV